jgi:hypothetical protein
MSRAPPQYGNRRRNADSRSCASTPALRETRGLAAISIRDILMRLSESHPNEIRVIVPPPVPRWKSQ